VHSVGVVKKSVWIFLLIVFLPAAVLGWLALRSADEQRFILERRTAELFQTQADNVATAVREAIIVEQRNFSEAVRRLIAEHPDTEKLARDFPRALPDAWARKAVGFSMGPGGKILAPTPTAAVGNKEWGAFLWDYSPFLSSAKPAVVYASSNDNFQGKAAPSVRSKLESFGNALSAPSMKKSVQNRTESKTPPYGGIAASSIPQKAMEAGSSMAPLAKAKPAAAAPQKPGTAKPVEREDAVQQAMAAKDLNAEVIDRALMAQQSRLVQPAEAEGNWSAIMPATAEFAELTKNADEGMIARFVQDKLDLIFWLRPPEAPSLIFGCLIEAASLKAEWPALLGDYVSGTSRTAPEHIVALLDDKARPVATLPAGAIARDWKRPFVASEIGEAFPHWEAAIYLAKPGALAENARGVHRTIAFLIAGAIGLIAIGGWLVVSDVRRQLALAQQKTDFVSNVSHELKTPLTSIRMFAELMHARPQPPEKQSQFLRIISVESERLTRLINNVLDFAKLERKQRHFEKKPIDLHDVVCGVWENSEVHLREAGFATAWTAAPAPYPVTGDADALAQVLVNLISNAEKYSGERKEVELHTWCDDGFILVSVLDRGTGVPAGDERKIFEAFYRAHDSLSSGIQGSGLGLTLAQQIAAAHGGSIDYEARDGGGSRFTLRLPLRAS
jgi:signal transduction histidine kinase